MSDPARAREVLHELDDMGLTLKLMTTVKGSHRSHTLSCYLIDMLNDPNDLIIVRSTIDLAHNLGMVVIAEGVENNDILKHLQQLKCDVAQGYFISKPLPKQQLLDWLVSYNYEKMIA